MNDKDGNDMMLSRVSDTNFNASWVSRYYV